MSRIKRSIGVIRRLRISSYVSMILLAFFFMGIITPFYLKPKDIEAATGTATESTMTFTSTSNTASVDFSVDSANGTAAISDSSHQIKFSIATNNYTGYKVYLNADSTKLTNDDDDTIGTLASGTPVSKTDFMAASGTAYNNKWGVIPNYYNSSANSTMIYGFGGTYGSILLRNTSAANSSAHSYTIDMAVRADYTRPAGAYINNTYIWIYYVANPVAYSITYNANTTDTVTNMPSPNPQAASDVTSTSITLSSNTPIRDDATFLGWCSVATTKSGSIDTCSGTTYQPGGSYGIDQTVQNVTTLYAMWDESGPDACNPSATTIDSAVCMQDMNNTVINSMVVGTQYRLRDNRDDKQYYVARMRDGKVWMTQNLDLDLETSPTVALTSENTDLNVYGTGAYTTNEGYSCSNTDSTNCANSGEIITWTPARATLAESDYGNWGTSNTLSYSWDGGDYYLYPSSDDSSDYNYTMAQCTNNGHSTAECTHYHVGNYYNFAAAVASNTVENATLSNRSMMGNSICPAGWRLPQGQTSSSSTSVGYYSEINYLWYAEDATEGFTTSTSNAVYGTDGFSIIRTAPLYTTRAGHRNNTNANATYKLSYGYYWTNTNYNATNYSYAPYFNSTGLYPGSRGSNSGTRSQGKSVRCIARQTNTGGTTTIVFNGNGSTSGTMSNQSINTNTIGTLTSNTYAQTGSVFGGWNTAADGTGVSYADGSKFYRAGSDNQTVTLYAQWKQAVTFTAGNNIAMIIVAAAGEDYKPYYIDSSQALDTGVGPFIVTVVPEPSAKLQSWTRSTNNGTFGSDSLLTTTFTPNGSEFLTANGAVGSYTSMKDLTLANCSTTGVNVTDERNNRSYTVAKIGNYCYMLSNLRLEGETALNSTTSDVSANTFTLPSQSGTGTSQIHYCEARMNYINGEYYYNWYAAKANPTTGLTSSEDCATETYDNASLGSICPKNWTLPTYSDITPTDLWDSGANPGMLSTTGYASAGSQFDYTGEWWSSSRKSDQDDSAYALNLYKNSGVLTTGRNYDHPKSYEYSVRCMRSS